MASLHNLDLSLFRVLNAGAANRVFDVFMPFVTNLHQRTWFVALALAFCAAVLWRGTRRGRIWVLCALVALGLSDGGASKGIKKVVHRERPCYEVNHTPPMADPDTRLVPGMGCPGSNSFPSNHASNMMALGLVCWWFTRGRRRWLWFLLPLVVGYSRIYCGFHYPSDVLGGWLSGALVGAFVLWAASRMPRRADPKLGEEQPASSTA